MTTHSSVVAWRIPGTEEPGGLLSMGSHRVGRDWSNLAAAAGYLTDSKEELGNQPLVTGSGKVLENSVSGPVLQMNQSNCAF